MSIQSVKVVSTCASSEPLATRILSRSALHSQPTALTGCYTSHNQVAIAFGCEDGSIFTFMSATTLASVDSKQIPSIQMPSESQIAVARKRAPMSAPHPRASSPEPIYRPLSPSALSMSAFSNRSSSGTHTPNPLSVPSRARITQPGISRASIEAPKARVEVGDEQGKLRAMLAKGSTGGVSAKARRGSLGSLASMEDKGLDRSERKSGEASRGPMSLARSVVDIALGGIGVKPSGKSGSTTVLPTTHGESQEETASVASASISESTLATAAAVQAGLDVTSLKLELRSHILPAHGGTGEAVTGLEVVSDQDLCISLQASGTLSLLSVTDGYCLASVHADDLPRLTSPHGYKSVDTATGSWEWVKMSIVPYIESVMIMIAARPHPNSVSSRVTRARVVVYKIPEFNSDAVPDPVMSLEKVGEWLVDGDAKTVGFVTGYNGLTFAYINDKGHGVLAPLNMLPPPPESDLEAIVQQETPIPAPSIGMIPIPNPFDVFKPREVAKKATTMRHSDGRLLVGTEKDMGACWDWNEADDSEDEILGMRVCGQADIGDNVRFVIWTAGGILVYGAENSETELERVGKFSEPDIVNINVPSNSEFIVVRESGLDAYKIEKVDHNGNTTSAAKNALYYCSKPSTTTFHYQVQSAAVIPLLGQLCAVTIGTSSGLGLNIGLQNLYRDREGKRNEQAWTSLPNSSQILQTTAVLPVDVDSIFVARSDGRLYRLPFAEIQSDLDSEVTGSKLGARVTRLWFVTEEWSKTLFILGALDNGGIACWDARSLQLVAQWTIFITELESVISLSLGDDRLGRLKGCVMAVAAGGTIAIIVLDGMKLLCVIPGSPAPLDRICIGGDNLLLFYSHGLARLWDMKTHEFWRSMQQNKGEELLDQGGWFEVPVGRWEAPRPFHVLGALSNNISSPDAAATLIVDISSLAELAMARSPSQTVSKERLDVIRKQFAQVIAALAPCGVDEDVDAACKEAFEASQLPGCDSPARSERFGASSIVVSEDPAGVWKVSPRYTALRLLSIVALLRVATSFEEYEQHVSGVIAFYVGCLANTVGCGFQPPSLGVLATFWVSNPDEVRQAARSIFESRLAQMTEAEVVQCVTFWREYLPTLQPPSAAHSSLAVQALSVCGVIAASKHSLLPTVYVTEIAKSVALYLHDEAQASTSAANRILSIELCSRGFQVWQHHVDAMEMLRALFGFAVASPGTVKNTGGKEARAAVLQIAASSTPLFMTALSLDITQPKSTEHRRATMQLVAFIIRKKPLVLYPNLPRLVESVVKSLDPTSTAARDAIMDAATEILAEVVRVYPSVDFHMLTQKLAVGTPEGAVVVYDLKTATRLYVLEGHLRRLTVLSFSPDGRRLATASLEESVVMVWKVGASFSSWFAPGAPPRQGHGHGEPFKRLDFNVGDEAHMTVAATLEWVNFAWPTDRTARLSIRDSVLTFSC